MHDAITPKENRDLESKVFVKGRRRENRTADGFYYYDVGEENGVNNTIVVSDGAKGDQSVERVYRIALDSETDIEYVRDFIHDAEQQLGKRAYRYVESTYEPELVRAYRRDDFADYEELRVEQKRGVGGSAEGVAAAGYAGRAIDGEGIYATKQVGLTDGAYSHRTGFAVEHEGEEVADIIRDSVTKSYSLASWTAEERRTVRDTLLEKGYEPEAVEKWIDDVDSVASIVANDKARLDFTAAPDQVMLKNNQDYVKTLDASTLCAKHLLYQGTFNEIQHLLPNTPLTSDQLLDLLNMMKDAGYESPCGVCYVESRRRHLGKFAGQWLNGRPASKEQKAWAPYNGSYIPTLDELTTTDGLAKLKANHPETYNDFVKKTSSLGSANPKIVELRTDYRGDIRKISERDTEKIRRIGGLRVQSFSDFETPHMLDMMQATLDMASKSLTSQAYTKVPNFAWVFGDTGIKINLSLLAEGNGLDADGNLIFSSTEGMDIDEALRLRERYSDNVGTIIVGANDAHIRAAMADPRIDYIIPFHRSGWGQNELKKVGVLQTYTDYQESQNERTITGYKKNGKPEYGKPEGGNFYPIDYWDYSKTGDENAATYLRMCEEDGRVPKFDQFLEKDADGHWVAPSGYWKMLIDFKMYNNEGVGVPQQPVQPSFNMEEAHRVLEEYEGGADELPVAQDIVERFVSEYKAAYPRTQYSLPSDMVLTEMIDRYLARQEQGGVAPPNTAVGQPAQQAQPRMGKRQFANQTLQDSTAMPDWLKQELRTNPAESDYEIDSNYAQAERGWQRIQENGYAQERDRLLNLERFSADDTAEANLIMAMAEREGDAETLLAVASKYNREGTKASQEMQARKLFTKMSPTGAKAMVAGQLENRLQDELETHRPKQRRMNERAQRVAERLAGLPAPEETSSDNRWGVELNSQQMELIRHYGLEKTARPGIYYNRATIDQRMLEAIIATPNPLAATGNGPNLVQRLEYMDHRMAVVTNADLNYIGTQLGQFIGFGGELGGRDADLAVSRAYEAFGNITPTTLRQRMQTYRYDSMLGTLTSPERNIIGNLSQAVPNAVAHGVAANVVDPIVSLFTGRRTATSLTVHERVEGWKAFAEESKNTFKDFFIDRAEVRNRQEDKFSTNRSGRVYQSPVMELAHNMVSFAMSFGDRNFWKKAYVNSLAEQQRLLDRGLLHNEDGTTPTQEQILERAEADANYATFNEDNRVRDAVTAMKQVPGLGDVLDYIMPFTGVPTNIISRMWQFSPMGLVSTIATNAYRGMRGQNFDQRAFVNGISRGLTGTALFGVGMLLQAAGIIRLGTGDEEDDKKRGVRTAQGEQYTPFIYNPFKDEYVSLSTFAPAISPLIMGATAQDLFENEENKAVALQNAAFASLDQIFDASYMTGLSDIFNGYGSATENIATAVFASFASQNVPALLGQLSSAMDPYVRDTKDKNLIIEALKSGVINKIPGLREMLPKKIDVTGQPVLQGKEGLENFLNPFTGTNARDNEVLNELMRLSGKVGDSGMLPADALSGRKNSLTISGVDFTVDAAGKEAYKQRYGELWYNGGSYKDGNGNNVKVQGVADLIKSKEYAKMTDAEKAKAVEKVIKLAGSVAKAEAAVEAGEASSKVWETVTTNQKSVLKSNAQLQVEAGHYTGLTTFVADLKKAGSSASTIKSEVTKMMKPIYQELNRKGDTEAMKEIRRILYQTGLYDKYNFEKNWLK